MASVIHQNRLSLLDSLPKHGIAAELGVFIGDFSKEILRRTNPKRLYLVDLFNGSVTSGDENGENLMTVDMTGMRVGLELRFAGQPVTVVKANSVTWMGQQAPFSMDWVYIDTGHHFELTLAELLVARQCVKTGGYICGHDYSETEYGVKKSVDQFCVSFGLHLDIFDGDKLASFRIKNLWRDNMHGYWTKLPDMFKS